MADLNNLIVRGQTRLLNKLNASDVEISGTLKASTINSANVVKSLSISGKTITVTKGDGTTSALTTQDTNTTYAGDSSTITLSGTTFSQKSGIVTAGSAGPTANVSGSNGSTIKVPRITVDTYGRVTGLTEYTLTNVNTDTNTHANSFGKVTYGSSTLSAASATDTLTLAVSGGAGITVDTTNKKLTFSAPSDYSLPDASSSTKGGVKVGSNITVSSGTISLSKTNVTNALGYTPPKRLVFTDKTIATSAWADDTTYSDFPYKASISCSGVTSSYLAEVIFGLEDVISGIFAPINETGSNVVYIWASEKPSATITIPTISCLYN